MSKGKILVVDDSKTYLHFASSALERGGYEVLTADNAWISNIINKEKPDLVIMDVQLGAVSGVNAVAALRNRSFCKSTRIVLHSSENADALASMAKSCGADGYLPKDGNELTLLRCVRQVLSNTPTPAALTTH